MCLTTEQLWTVDSTELTKLHLRQYKLIYWIEGRKLPDAHVFNGRQENAKHNVTNIAVQWIIKVLISFHYFINTWS